MKEYKVITVERKIEADKLQKQLNELAAEGWCVKSAAGGNTAERCIFLTRLSNFF